MKHSRAIRGAAFGALLGLFLVGGAAAAPAQLGDGLFARIATSRGEIVVRLEFEKTPLTVCNFVGLAEGTLNASRGKPFYDGLAFHRVIADFMIQGGDPLGNGTGGPGYQFADEFDPSLKLDGPGVLAMANAGPGTNGSQFFITHKATPWLDGKHTVFGRVVSGQDVVNAVQQGDKIVSITIVRNGGAAKAFKADQDAWDGYAKNAVAAAAAKVAAKRTADLALAAQKWPAAKISASGIRFIVQKAGTGPKPAAGKNVQVKYKAMYLSGEVIDSTDQQGGPITVQVGVNKIIRGWDETLSDMQVGEKRLVVLPPELAFGASGNGQIPGNTFLVFEFELVAIK